MNIKKIILLIIYFLASIYSYSQKDTIEFEKEKYIWEYSKCSQGIIDSCLLEKYLFIKNKTLIFEFYNCGNELHYFGEIIEGKIQHEEYYNDDGKSVFAKYDYYYDSLNNLCKTKLISIEDTLKQAEQVIDNYYLNEKLTLRIFHNEFGAEIRKDIYYYNEKGTLELIIIKNLMTNKDEKEYYENNNIVKKIDIRGRVQSWQYDKNNRLIEYQKDKYNKENYIYSEIGLLEKIIRYRIREEILTEYEQELYTYNSRGDIVQITTQNNNSEKVKKIYWVYY